MLGHLADVSIRSLVLALIAGLALWTMRLARSVAIQHAVWTTVMAGMLALFVFGSALPRLPLPILRNVAAPGIVRLDTPEFKFPIVERVPATPMPAEHSIQWDEVAMYGYAAIAFAFLARFATGWWLARRLLITSIPVEGFSESATIAVPLTIGWFRPKILLPLEWKDWDRAKLRAVLLHEGAHVRRRDGLVAALAGINRCVFWFHPLAWWLERRLRLLAELACDEACVATLENREQYVSLLLEMARVVDGSRGRLRQHALTMAAASHIKQRVESLLQDGRTFSQGLSWTARSAIAVCGIPVVLGAGTLTLDRETALPRLPVPLFTYTAPPPPPPSRRLLAQAQPSPARPGAAPSLPETTPTFDVVSVKPLPELQPGLAVPPGFIVLPRFDDPQRFRARGMLSGPMGVLEWAHGMRDFQVSGAPEWLTREVFEIQATSEHPSSDSQMRQMVQALLADRFHLKAHRETRQLPVYALTVAKNGPKLTEAKDASLNQGSGFFNAPPGKLSARGGTMALFAMILTDNEDRPVVDKTNLTRHYDFDLTFEGPSWSPDEPGSWKPFGTAIFRPIESLGLKLEPQKDAVEVLVIDSIDRPSAN